MYFMNAMDIEDHNARVYMRSAHFGQALPNTYTGAEALLWLMHWADHNSDGWAYWPKPARAAEGLMLALDEFNGPRWDNEGRDIPSTVLKATLVPIKAFLTRQGVPAADRPLELR